MCFCFITSFIILLQDFSSTAWLTISLFSCFMLIFSSCGIMPAVLSRPDFRIFRTKFSQDLAVIWWIIEVMDDTIVFVYNPGMLYIPFSMIANALTHLRVSDWQGGVSSHFISVTSAVGIWPHRFFIRRFYYTFINIFCYFHEFKHVNSCFKGKKFTIKSLHTCLLAPAVGHTVYQNLF